MIQYIVLAGKAKDVFKELSFIAQLEKITGLALVQYRPGQFNLN